MKDLTLWQFAAIYLCIAVPMLVLFCRGCDTEASEIPKDLN